LPCADTVSLHAVTLGIVCRAVEQEIDRLIAFRSTMRSTCPAFTVCSQGARTGTVASWMMVPCRP
jgi:hypothetical protein